MITVFDIRPTRLEIDAPIAEADPRARLESGQVDRVLEKFDESTRRRLSRVGALA
jgi:hypothetical protein